MTNAQNTPNATLKEEALGDVEDADIAVTMVAAQLHLAVKRAREAGASWQEIGDTLGISRQAAHERFNK